MTPPDLRQLAQALIAKLDAMHADRSYHQIFVTLPNLHGCGYTGPNYAAELEALRAAVAGERDTK